MTVSKCDYTEEKTKIHIVILMKRDITRDQLSELQSRHVRYGQRQMDQQRS